jgi:hypothetical protein
LIDFEKLDLSHDFTQIAPRDNGHERPIIHAVDERGSGDQVAGKFQDVQQTSRKRLVQD